MILKKKKIPLGINHALYSRFPKVSPLVFLISTPPLWDARLGSQFKCNLMAKVGCLGCGYSCFRHHLFQSILLKELKLHMLFSFYLLVGAAIDSVSCAGEWEVAWAQWLWAGWEVPVQQLCDSVLISTV